MNATTVIAFTYEADTHCIDCATRRFGDAGFPNIVPLDATDAEGNEPHPVFGSSEWWNTDDASCENLICGTCRDVVAAAHAEGCENWMEDEVQADCVRGDLTPRQEVR